MAAARTGPTPGTASRSSETRMRARASSVCADLISRAMLSSPVLSCSFAKARLARALAAFSKASERSSADKAFNVTDTSPFGRHRVRGGLDCSRSYRVVSAERNALDPPRSRLTIQQAVPGGLSSRTQSGNCGTSGQDSAARRRQYRRICFTESGTQIRRRGSLGS